MWVSPQRVCLLVGSLAACSTPTLPPPPPPEHSAESRELEQGHLLLFPSNAPEELLARPVRLTEDGAWSIADARGPDWGGFGATRSFALPGAPACRAREPDGVLRELRQAARHRGGLRQRDRSGRRHREYCGFEGRHARRLRSGGTWIRCSSAPAGASSSPRRTRLRTRRSPSPGSLPGAQAWTRRASWSMRRPGTHHKPTPSRTVRLVVIADSRCAWTCPLRSRPVTKSRSGWSPIAMRTSSSTTVTRTGKGAVLWPSRQEPAPRVRAGTSTFLPSANERRAGVRLGGGAVRSGTPSRARHSSSTPFGDEGDFRRVSPAPGAAFEDGGQAAAELTERMDRAPLSRWTSLRRQLRDPAGGAQTMIDAVCSRRCCSRLLPPRAAGPRVLTASRSRRRGTCASTSARARCSLPATRTASSTTPSSRRACPCRALAPSPRAASPSCAKASEVHDAEAFIDANLSFCRKAGDVRERQRRGDAGGRRSGRGAPPLRHRERLLLVGPDRRRVSPAVRREHRPSPARFAAGGDARPEREHHSRRIRGRPLEPARRSALEPPPPSPSLPTRRPSPPST